MLDLHNCPRCHRPADRFVFDDEVEDYEIECTECGIAVSAPTRLLVRQGWNSMQAEPPPPDVHTPGPWCIRWIDEHQRGAPEYGEIIAQRGDAIAYCRTSCADTRLIAAAPDLLDALDGLAANVSGSLKLAGDDLRLAIGNTNVQVIEHFLGLAAAAIARAKTP